MRNVLLVVFACGALAVGHLLTPTTAADRTTPALPAAPVPPPTPAPNRLVAHEWRTFTSFSGSDGVPASFSPDNADLPGFVYYPFNQYSKGARLSRGGFVSMETPVIYFYTDRDTKLSVTVDFPKGWITEWYPFAHGAPPANRGDRPGQSIRWNVKLTPDEPGRFPIDKGNRENHYYHARETDAVPLQSEVVGRTEDQNNSDESQLRGGTVLQREKFLFYRGVGTFPPPVTVRALGGDRVRVVNGAGGKATGLVLVAVRAGRIGFSAVGELEAGATADAQLPSTNGTRAELGELLVKELTAAGLYEKEARAMVKTWDSAWFGEEGTRLLYLVPRTKTDELLPLTMDPKPAELVRVLVGRHDFLTPEQESTAEKQLRRLRAAQNEVNAASGELAKLGRFSPQAQQMAAKRLDATTATAPQK